VGVCMFLGIYISFFRQVRKLATGYTRTFFFGLLLFVLVRGLTDTEPFDLSLPLWAIAMMSVLIERVRVREDTAVVSLAVAQ